MANVIANLLDPGQSHELRDATGTVVGYYLPVREYARLRDTNGAVSEPPARVALEQRCKELSAECEQLRAELKQATADRDAYLKAVYAMLREQPGYNEVNFTREEVFACLEQRPTFEELIEEVEKELQRKDHA